MKAIWRLAWPVIFSNVTIPLLGMVDIAVVGHDYPQHVLGAVAIGTMVFDVLFPLFGFLRMSTTGLVAQNPKDLNLLYRALCVAGFISVLLCLIQPFLWQLITFFIDMNDAVTASLKTYFSLRMYAAPATLLNFVILGYFFGRENTKIPLYLLMLMNLSAISLDFILVRYFDLGVQGLAAANVIAQTLGCMVGLWFIHTRFGFKKQKISAVFNTDAIKRLFYLNQDILIRTLCLMATFAYFTAAGSRLGTRFVAANAILLSMHHFVAYGLDGFAIACEVMVGRALGQKNKAAFIQAVWQCGYCSLGVAAFFSLTYLLLGNFIIEMMSSLPHIVADAKRYLIWVIALPIASVGGFLLDGVFIGATWSRPMRNTMLVSTGLIYFPSVFLLANKGNTGLWIAFTLFMLARGVSLAIVLIKRMKHFDTLYS